MPSSPPSSGAAGRGERLFPEQGVRCHHRPRPLRGCPSPPPTLLPGRSAARDAMLAAGRRRRGHLHGLKAKRLRPSVLFLAGSSGQRGAAPLRRRGGRGGRRGRTEPAGRADGPGTGGERLPQASRSQPGCGAPPPPAPAPAAASRERQGEAGRGRETQAAASGVPSLRPRFAPGWRLSAWLLPRRSRGAPGPCRWPVLGWSWERFSLLPSPPSLSWPSPRLRSGSR